MQGRDELFAAEDVVRVDRARTLKASDLEFLTRFLLILDSGLARVPCPAA